MIQSDIHNNKSEKLPKIGVVIIGVNSEKYLQDCIESVLSADYPADLIEIVYVDGGSMDSSPQIAGAFREVKVIELRDTHPTPGRGRNKGWQSTSAGLIQFLDSDTLLDPQWFKKAVQSLNNNTVAVCGHRRERYPEKNIFHLFTEMEWNYEVGPCRYFGGDVLIKREVLEKTGGFDEELIAGEDPELSYRIRQKGWNILRIDSMMTLHDINMNTLKQYMRRAYRSGYAYAEIGLRFIKNKEKMWSRELLRIMLKALTPFVLVLIGVLIGKLWWGVLLGSVVFCTPILRIGSIKGKYQKSWKYSLLYTLHTAVVIYPQFNGVLRYLRGKVSGAPLRNKGIN